MGLIKTALGSAFGADQPNNGFNGPRMPFTSSRPKSRSRESVESSRVTQDRYPQYGYEDRRQQYGYEDRDSRYGYQDRSPQYGYQDERRFQVQEKAHLSPHAIDYASQYDQRDKGSLNPYYHPRTQATDYIANNDFDQSYPDNYGPPPSYERTPSRNLSPNSPLAYQRQPSYESMSSRSRSPASQVTYQRQPSYSHPSPPRSRSRSTGFRPVALPQVKYGDGQPFLRGYSVELERYGITEEQFIRVVDQINIAVIPNPENLIFQKAANIAGWFVPGIAGISLMAGQIGVGITAAFGHASLVARNLSKANLEVFLPNGLELCIGKTKDLDNEIGVDSSNMAQSPGQDGAASPVSRMASYGDLVARLDYTYAPAQNTGRSDPLAKLGNALSEKAADKKMKKAQRGGKRQGKRVAELESSVKWLLVRRATPAALEHWRKTLDQSTAALKEEEEAQAGRR